MPADIDKICGNVFVTCSSLDASRKYRRISLFMNSSSSLCRGRGNNFFDMIVVQNFCRTKLPSPCIDCTKSAPKPEQPSSSEMRPIVHAAAAFISPPSPLSLRGVTS